MKYVPLFGVRASRTPTLIGWGSNESSEFARQASAMHAASQAMGNCTELVAQLDANHFSAIYELEEPGSPLCRWLAAALTQTPK